MPIGVVFCRIDVDRLVRPAMHRQVGLAIAVEIESPQRDATGHRLFEDAGRNSLALPLHCPGQPYIDGNDLHRPHLPQWPALWPPSTWRISPVTKPADSR